MNAVVLHMPKKSPQVEDGHLKIANELFEAIMAFPFGKNELRVLLAVLRKTYGYGKKEDDLSASQLGALLGTMARPHITTALNVLATMGVIHKRPGKYGSIVGINKDYSKWNASTKSVQGGCTETVHPASTDSVQVYGNGTSSQDATLYEKGVEGCTDSVQVASTESVHTKDNLPKDNQQKESADADSCDDQLPLLDAEPGNAPPPVVQLPLQDGSEFSPTDAQVAEWSAAFPLVDVPGALKRMRVWCAAKPANRKTRRGIAAFIVNWLSGDQDKATNPQANRPGRNGKPQGGQIHGNFNDQDYRAGVSEDGRF
jgi:phage replication O-like protein O